MNTIEAITIDPRGFVVLHFKDWETRAEFMKCVPAGDAFGLSRPSADGKTLTWRLTDLPFAFTLR